MWWKRSKKWWDIIANNTTIGKGELTLVNLIVSNKQWHRKYVGEIEIRTNTKIIYLDRKEQLTLERVRKYSPRYIFFPHWSYYIPEEIYSNYECVIFHMTDLPYGRGGSPLQNLIARGVYETKLSALRCVHELDAGDIYQKRNLSLYGNAEEIYLRTAELIKEMVIEIIQEQPVPKEQKGKVVTFPRRTPPESDLKALCDLKQVFDWIRMLDAQEYPKAFLQTEHLHLEFERASLKDGYVKADVTITRRQEV